MFTDGCAVLSEWEWDAQLQIRKYVVANVDIVVNRHK